MYFLRGFVASLSVFVLLYVAWSVVVCCLWRYLQRPIRKLSPASAANALYALRTSPFFVPLLVVAGLSVPSFLRYEPRATGESIGILPLALTLLFAVFGVVNTSRAWKAYSRTRRSIRQWTSGAAVVRSSSEVDFFQAADNAPAVALAGISKPALVISAAASASLTPRELSRTVAHELAHLRARDNLKKLLLHACAFPGMAGLEQAWLETVEFSADSAAVHDEAEALDLASALVKISRLKGCGPLPELASGLVEGRSSLLEARVQRLIEWGTNHGSVLSSSNRLGILTTIGFVAAVTLLNYPTLLKSAHALTEFLVR